MTNIRAITTFLVLINFVVVLSSKAQIQVDTTATPLQLLETLLGSGVQVSNLQYHGDGQSKGLFTTLNKTNLGIDSGIVLSTGLSIEIPNAVGFFMSNVLPPSNGDSDPDLDALAGSGGHDATVLEFDFIPFNDTIQIKYVFGSEEYPEYACSNFNDIFAFFLSEPNPVGTAYNYQNIAKIPETNHYVAINSVNIGPGGSGSSTNCIPPGSTAPYSMYYVDNQGISGQYITFDGFTTVLTAFSIVQPCQNYHIKIAIQEHGDQGAYDSGVFLEAGSFSSPGIAITPVYTTPGGGNFAVEGCTQADLIITLPLVSPDTTWLIFDSIRGTAINGIDCNLLNDTMMILPGQLSDTLSIIPIFDDLAEVDETLIFYYSSSTPCMGTTVASVTVTIANFTKVNLGQDTTVCQGQTVVFDAGPGYGNYTWQDGTKFQTFNASTSGTYTVQVEDEYGCASSDSVDLLVAPLPAAIPIKHN